MRRRSSSVQPPDSPRVMPEPTPANSGREPIPAPPRLVRWRAVLRVRFVLAIASVLLMLPSMILGGTLATLGVDVLPFRDDILDAEHEIVEGRVTHVDAELLRAPTGTFDRVAFEFWTADGSRVTGHSFAPSSAEWTGGSACQVECVLADTGVARIRATRLNPIADLWSRLLGLTGLPGLALGLFWLRGVMRTRLQLATGPLAIARVVGSRRVFGVSPPQLAVTFEFDAPDGTLVRTAHWVGERTPLGAALRNGAEHPPVVFDPGAPTRGRLVHRSDFAP